MVDPECGADVFRLVAKAGVTKLAVVEALENVDQHPRPPPRGQCAILACLDLDPIRSTIGAKAETAGEIVLKRAAPKDWLGAEIHQRVSVWAGAAHPLPCPNEGGVDAAVKQEPLGPVEKLRLYFSPPI